ncbi:hypothetical protein HW561_19820 [Rhodobacteraceae bacterium B1Z28]|uniref:T4 beta protein n=1 Tax=Ruegeria haliotis TaxID=2747601 RepID=A0ABX2PV40_9RHOB|nr:hypothetical protein [Ruegeria haliotis]NVO58048.1 hypothetical protein [Ruegeria haliotis]
MASIIRSINDLPTLRCSIGVRNRKPVLLTQPYIGADKLDSELETPFIAPDGQEFLQHTLSQPNLPVARHIEILHKAALEGVPLWLQLSQDSADAALLPWEEAIFHRTGRRTLRISNFVKPLHTAARPASGCVCIGTHAKGDFSLTDEIAELLTSLAVALNENTYDARVSVFAPPWETEKLRRYLSFADTGGLLIDIVDLSPAGYDPAPQTRSISDSPQVTNPWLRWIQDHHRDTGLDGVHFICPGYTARDQGALALAESPGENDDTRWARFVGQDELMRFYDPLGVSIMGFTAMGSSRWADGIHSPAYQLSWARPGPTYVKPAGPAAYHFGSLLRGIWTPSGIHPELPPQAPAYAYPDMLVPAALVADLVEVDPPFVTPHPEGETWSSSQRISPVGDSSSTGLCTHIRDHPACRGSRPATSG